MLSRQHGIDVGQSFEKKFQPNSYSQETGPAASGGGVTGGHSWPTLSYSMPGRKWV